jgi:hypothetical protein
LVEEEAEKKDRGMERWQHDASLADDGGFLLILSSFAK